jgi:alanyl-tRNA synthetase
LFAHQTRIEKGEIAVGDTLSLSVDHGRRGQIRANHSATHLLHEALRQRLGLHVAQKGSLVAPDRLRFDFSQPSAIEPGALALVESDVNHHIRENSPVATRLMTPEEAIEEGAMALFGEKYGDEVRVVSMGRDGRYRAVQDHRRGCRVERHPARRGADRRGCAAMVHQPRRETARGGLGAEGDAG